MLLQVIDSLCLLGSQSPFGVIEPGLLDLLGRSLIFHEAPRSFGYLCCLFRTAKWTNAGFFVLLLTRESRAQTRDLQTCHLYTTLLNQLFQVVVELRELDLPDELVRAQQPHPAGEERRQTCR